MYSRKGDTFTMKLRNLLWLPIAAMLLNSCALGKKVEPSVAQERALAATKANEEAEIDTQAITSKSEFSDTIKSYEGETVVTETSTLKFESSFKAKGLHGDTPEFAATYKEMMEEKVDGVETYYVNHEEAFYLKDSWLFGDFSTTVRERGETETEENKGKVKIVPIDFKVVSVFDYLSGFSAGEYQFGAPNEEELAILFQVASEIEAKELFGKLTITYKLDVKSLVLIMLLAFGRDLDAMTEEEREAFDTELNTMVEEMSKVMSINKYQMTLGISKDGYVEKIRTDIDMVTNEYNEEVEPKVLVASEELKTFTESTMEINKKLTIKYPNIDDYPEAQPIIR